VIDETSGIAANRGVDRDIIVDSEQKGMMPVHRVVVIPTISFFRADLLAGIFYDARPFSDATGGEDAASLNFRLSNAVDSGPGSWHVSKLNGLIGQ